jgi:hypothetical protein
MCKKLRTGSEDWRQRSETVNLSYSVGLKIYIAHYICQIQSCLKVNRPKGSYRFHLLLHVYKCKNTVSFIQNRTLTTTHEPLREQNDENNGNIESLQAYHVVAADALLEIGTAVISAFLSLDEHLSQTNTSCVPKFCYQSVYCFPIRYFLVRIRLLNASRTATDVSMRINIREWTHVLLVITSYSHLHSYCATVMSSGLAIRVTLTWMSWRRFGESITGGGGTFFWFNFCCVVLSCSSLIIDCNRAVA